MVVGKLVRLWSWAELNRIQPNDIGVTKEFIDKLVGRKGFAAALAQTGWLVETDGKLSFRNFKRHNSPVAQNKALTAKRVARHRLRKAATEKKVTAEPLAAPVSPEVQAEALDPIQNNAVTIEEVTIQTLPSDVESVVIETSFEENIDDGSNVINTSSSLETNDEHDEYEEQGDANFVTLLDEPPVFIEEQETPPPEAPEEAPPVVQQEDPAPRKRRAKAAQDTSDQPMLF